VQEVAALREVAVRLDYMICQITPQEFSWQDANYDRDLVHGRELLFLMADDEWVRATSETIGISRADAVDTTIKIDVDLGRVTHEAFRARTGQLWLPVLILPPLQQRLPEPDPFSTLTVTDTGGTRLPALPNTDVRHRIAAALTEMLLAAAEAWPPHADAPGFTAARGHRLVLSAAIYRLLRREHVPAAVLERTVPARRRGAAGPLPRFGRMRRELEDVLDRFSGSLADDGAPGDDDDADAGDSAMTRQLAERAIGVLQALSESAVVVVAVERGLTPTVLTVTVPGRALHQAPAGQTDTDELAAGPGRGPWGQERKPSWRWLSPAHWVLPRAHLRIDLLLPSADADRQIQVNLPDGVSPDPSRPLTRRAELDIRTGQPPPVSQLAELIGELEDTDDDWPLELYMCLADLAAAKADAVAESLRDHQVEEIAGDPPTADGEAPAATGAFRERLEALTTALRKDQPSDDVTAARGRVSQAWGDGDWLRTPMMRRTSIETVSPDVIVARARMIEDLSQRAVPTQARINVNIAVTDSVYFSTARLSGLMSTLLMAVVLIFFILDQALSLGERQVSADVLAFVLTLFSAIQAGRIERADRSTVRGMLAPAGNPLILGSILPTVVLAVALAFSLTAIWAIAWAGACIVVQLLLLWWQLMLLRRALARGLRPADPTGDSPPSAGLVLYTEAIDYGYLEVLQSRWWRTTTADALMAGHRAHAYLVWQHGAPPPSHTPATLDSLLRGGRPNADAGGHPGSGDGGHPGPGLSPPERPADVVALLRSGTGAQSLTFAVFRDEPKADWDFTTEDVVKVHLRPSHFAPFEGPTGVVGVFLGLDPGQGLQPVGQHPVTAVLRAAARLRLTVLEVQLPVPAPSVTYSDLQWARVQIGLRDSDVRHLTPFLSELNRLAVPAVVGVQTVAVGLPRILNPRPAAARPGLTPDQEKTAHHRLVMASDLDVVAASGAHLDGSETTESWRVMAVGADWRSGVEAEILDTLDPGLRLAGLTSAILHGKAVFLLLCHRPGGPGGTATGGSHGTGTGPVTVYLDRWQSRTDLGVTRRYPLLRVHMRTPNRPGATLEVLEALRDTLKEVAPGGGEWDVWYARVVVSTDNAGVIQLTVRLAFHPHPSAFAEIERRALALAAGKMTAGQTGGAAPDAGPDAPVNTVISVGLVNMPDLDS
jgi:hypothetical protein